MVEHISPSGKYGLVISEINRAPGCWSHTRGIVLDTKTGSTLAEINRNYSVFPFLFVEGHPLGDLFVCGEHYQGQTILNLPTGERKNYPPNHCFGFCWAKYTASPNKQLLAVEGCFWGGPYDVQIIDFANPMQDLPVLKSINNAEFLQWVDEDHCELKQEYRLHIPTNKPRDELTDEESDAADALEDAGEILFSEESRNIIV